MYMLFFLSQNKMFNEIYYKRNFKKSKNEMEKLGGRLPYRKTSLPHKLLINLGHRIN